MKFLVISILLMFLLFNVDAQKMPFQPPDYELIKREINDSSSVYYYPKLMSRLISFDTTLSNNDYRHLYYGYLFHPDYDPYRNSEYEQKLLKFYQSKNVRKKDYNKIIDLATKSIMEFPFDLRQMAYLGYIYHLKGDNDMAKFVSKKFQGILGAILSSGDGMSCKTGFHVITTSHEYVILNFFQFQFKSQVLIGKCDFMKIVIDDRDIDGIYFNIEKLLEQGKM